MNTLGALSCLGWRRALRSLPTFLVVLTSVVLFAQSSKADSFDTARQQWYNQLTGGTSFDPTDPDFAALISTITTTANGNWSSMVTTGGNTRAYLWPDLTSFSTLSVQITTMAQRLQSMALAYSTYGSPLYQNAQLATDIAGGLDWLYANCYNPSKTEYSNWFDWEINTPLNLDNIMVLLYSTLTSTQISNYCSAIDHFTPAPKGTGANLLWTCTVVAVRGFIVKDATKISSASSGIGPLFQYSYTDGFHVDGSFLQHTAHFPYNGGYGLTIIQNLEPFIEVLQNSPWPVTDPSQSNMFQWVYEAYEPLIYKGGFMSMVSGREIARSYDQDHFNGHKAMEYLLPWTNIASASDALAYKQMIKYWSNQDTFLPFIPSVMTISHLIMAKALMADNTISPMSDPVMAKPYPEMDRYVHLRPDFGFGISMFSTRISNFESITGENFNGWFTASGMTYLYNADLGCYDNNFWPTVDPYYLPGTTVSQQVLAAGANEATASSCSWVGSSDLKGLYGAAGMQLVQVSHVSTLISSSLTANKAWFMFDHEIAALGNSITCTDNTDVTTTVENRQIPNGNNIFNVNGVAQLSTLPSTGTFTNVNRIYLAGTASTGADIGYYFPTPSTITASREIRQHSWSEIGTGDTTQYTDNFMKFWIDHGTNPTGASYAYVILPNYSSSAVDAYAASPTLSVLENTNLASAVKETNLNVVAADFWQDVSHTVDLITSDKKSIVMTQESPGASLAASVTDPTQLGSTVDVELARSATGVLAADSTVTITQLAPTIKFTVNVYAGTPNTNQGNGIRGNAWNVTFNLATPTSAPATPSGLIATTVSTSQINLSWTTDSGAASYTIQRSTTSGGPYSTIATQVLSPHYSDMGLAQNTTYYYVVQAANSAGTSGFSAQASAKTLPELSTILSINFQGGSTKNGTPSLMATTETAGVYSAANWNNAGGASGNLNWMNDANGQTTGVDVTWSAYTTWSTSITESPGNSRMMKGYLDTSNTSTTSINLSGLPALYNVCVYCDGDNGTTTKTGQYTIGTTTIPAIDNAGTNFSGTFTQANNSAGNYVLFTNLTASSITLSATGTSTDSGPRAPINGIQIIPVVPPAPTGQATSVVSTTQVNLSWSPTTGAESYNVLRGTSSGGPYTVVQTGLTATSFSDVGLAPNTTYYYVIQAVNSAGASSNSAEVSGKTLAELSTILSINFQGGSTTNGTPSAMGTSETAGINSAANWNNASGASGNLALLSDANGQTSAVAISWSSNNTWSTPITESAGNYRMMKGYIDTNDTSTTTVNVTGLPALYNVCVYCDGDNGTHTRTGRYTIGSTTITATDNAGANFSGSFTQASNSAGNYVLFTNQTASSFTLSATGTSTDSGPRAPINGLQIIPVVPSAPTGLATSAVTTTQMSLSWTASLGAESYNVLRSTISGGPYSLIASGVTGTTFTNSGLSSSTTYYYVVQAVNSAGTSVNSTSATATTVAAIISINFQGGSTTNGNPAAMASTETAGVVAVANWNNAAGASGTAGSLKDQNGSATSASVTWGSNNTWSTPITESAGNYRMMKGYIDTSNTSTTTITISGLPSGYSKVYLYCDGDNGGSQRTGRYTIGSTTITATDAASTNFSGSFVQANNSAGNYVVFTNVTGSTITLTATGTSTNSTPRAPINGIQITP